MVWGRNGFLREVTVDHGGEMKVGKMDWKRRDREEKGQGHGEAVLIIPNTFPTLLTLSYHNTVSSCHGHLKSTKTLQEL